MSAQTPRGKAYTDAEIDSLLETIEDILPRCSNHWETVRSSHTSYYPDLGRTTESLKRKFASLYNYKKPTGDPTCPPQVRRAKAIWENIKSRMGIAVDDDRSSILGEDEVLESTEVNQGEENQDMNRDTQFSNVQAFPSMNVGDADDLSSSNPDSSRFRPLQISTPRVARSMGRQRQAREPSQFVEIMQMMIAREDAERDRENRRQQEREEREERYRREREREREEREERYRCEHQEAEDHREQRLERQMQQHMEMMQIMMMSIANKKKLIFKNKNVTMKMIRSNL